MSRHFRSLPHSNVAALGEFGSFNISGITLARTCLKAPIVSAIMCAYHIKWRALCSICITIAGITSYGQVHTQNVIFGTKSNHTYFYWNT